MIIRKLYKIESAHWVPKAYSRRCSYNIHGHSGKIEVFFKAHNLNDAEMVIDFGQLKDIIGSFIDMFDHSIHIPDVDYWVSDEDLDYLCTNTERWIHFPGNPTAENYAVFFRDCINELLKYVLDINLNSNYTEVTCSAVRYHETDTGYAESEPSDTVRFGLEDLIISEQTFKEASADLQTILKGTATIIKSGDKISISYNKKGDKNVERI